LRRQQVRKARIVSDPGIVPAHRAASAPLEVVLRCVDRRLDPADAVAAGLGVGWLLCPLGDARAGLKRLEPPPAELDTQVWVLTHPDLKRVARIHALTDFLYDRLSKDPRLAH
jgi:DNA-binding transcriptional LysR family regulator